MSLGFIFPNLLKENLLMNEGFKPTIWIMISTWSFDHLELNLIIFHDNSAHFINTCLYSSEHGRWRMPFSGDISILQIRKAKNIYSIDLIALSTWESHCVHLQVVCFASLYFDFHFQPGHLYVRPQKISQDCFLWNRVTPFYFTAKIVYFFQRTSFFP